MKIDAVITWVNGNDAAHRAKRVVWGNSNLFQTEDKAADTRFADIGEIFWCVASLNRFATWLNKIYIVTDDQNPNLESFLRANFGEEYIPFEIIDHKVIFKGYEEYLPTFNSISIETMTWRIPGLSDCYIEFNDDLVLLAPVRQEDFFTEDGKVICYADWACLPITRLTRLLKSSGKVTTKGSHTNGALVAGEKIWYLRLAHSQKALRRDFYQEYFKSHPGNLIRNISYRFRNADQFTSQELQYLSLYRSDKCIVRSAKGNLFFFQPKSKKGYFDNKMHELMSFKGKFACFNSMDLASKEEIQTLKEWLENKLSVRF